VKQVLEVCIQRHRFFFADRRDATDVWEDGALHDGDFVLLMIPDESNSNHNKTVIMSNAKSHKEITKTSSGAYADVEITI